MGQTIKAFCVVDVDNTCVFPPLLSYDAAQTAILNYSQSGALGGFFTVIEVDFDPTPLNEEQMEELEFLRQENNIINFSMPVTPEFYKLSINDRFEQIKQALTPGVGDLVENIDGPEPLVDEIPPLEDPVKTDSRSNSKPKTSKTPKKPRSSKSKSKTAKGK